MSLPPSREDKLRILEDDRRANTRSAYTGVTDPVAGGRFAKALGEYTVGATPTVEYPKLPEGSQWGGRKSGSNLRLASA
jgi:hypothetical protein